MRIEEEIQMGEPPMASVERPTGVTILAVLEILVGVSGIFGGLLGVLGVIEIGVRGLFYFIFIIGFLNLAVGWGLWTLKKWAYQVALILAIIGIITGILSLPMAIISLIINVLIIYYLTRPEIKEVFGVTGFLS